MELSDISEVLKRVFRAAFQGRNRYGIRRFYNHRAQALPHDDTANRDQFQAEVYALAEMLFRARGLTTVCDYGCGSAFKLRQHFADDNRVGVEVEPTLQWLRRNYPEDSWLADDELEGSFDLVICSDVIEHLAEPDRLLRRLKELSPKYLVLSTPARDLSPYLKARLGPPMNPYHCREWTQQEFADFVSGEFKIEMQLISNFADCTQLLICK